MLQEKNAFVSLFSWLYANFIVTNSGNAGCLIGNRCSGVGKGLISDHPQFSKGAWGWRMS